MAFICWRTGQLLIHLLRKWFIDIETILWNIISMWSINVLSGHSNNAWHWRGNGCENVIFLTKEVKPAVWEQRQAFKCTILSTSFYKPKPYFIGLPAKIVRVDRPVVLNRSTWAHLNAMKSSRGALYRFHNFFLACNTKNGYKFVVRF